MRIALYTNLRDTSPGYSPLHVISDQVSMLRRYGHECHCFVSETFPPDADLRGAAIHRVLPDFGDRRWKRIADVYEVVSAVREITDRLIRTAPGYDVVFTHDWIFHDRLAPFAEALALSAPATRSVPFFHWIHSVPTRRRDWWELTRYGPNHRIVYPNRTDSASVAAQFRAAASDVIHIPHIVDPRLLFGFSDDACRVIDAMPGLMEADVVQVYPAAADRLKHKGLDRLIRLFKEIKAQGRTVCLLVADSWDGRGHRADLRRYRRIALGNGLTGEEFRFISALHPRYRCGLRRGALAELMLLSNLFCFPTLGESFGLILPEGLIAGGGLPVPNGSLPMLREVVGGNGIFPHWGSCEESVHHENEAEFVRGVAAEIVDRLENDPSPAAKTYCRQRYNMDAVYRRHWAPLLGGTDGRS